MLVGRDHMRDDTNKSSYEMISSVRHEYVESMSLPKQSCLLNLGLR